MVHEIRARVIHHLSGINWKAPLPKWKKRKKYLCFVSSGWPMSDGQEGWSRGDSRRWGVSEVKQTCDYRCLQLATLYLPTKVTIFVSSVLRPFSSPYPSTRRAWERGRGRNIKEGFCLTSLFFIFLLFSSLFFFISLLFYLPPSRRFRDFVARGYELQLTIVAMEVKEEQRKMKNNNNERKKKRCAKEFYVFLRRL